MKTNCEIDFRPMLTWHGKKPERKPDRWDNPADHTMRSLTEELIRNEISDALLETYHDRSDLKMNGLPKAGSTPTQPGVQIWFKINELEVCLSCNRFKDWMQNIKALQMTLRSRRLEREYGCASIKEQYAGHAQLPAGNSSLAIHGPTDLKKQAQFVVTLAKVTDYTAENIVEDKTTFEAAYRAAAKHAHPDKGGSAELLTALTKAREAIYAYKGW